MTNFERSHFGGSLYDDHTTQYGLDPRDSWMYQERVREARRLLEARLENSRYDKLTGLLDDSAFREEAPILLKRLEKPQRKTDPNDAVVIMFDVEKLGDINNKRGQVAGDRAMRALGEVLRNTFRTENGDLVARTGGDETTAILPLFHDISIPRDELRQQDLEDVLGRLVENWNSMKNEDTPTVRVYYAFLEADMDMDQLRKEADPKTHKELALRLIGTHPGEEQPIFNS